MSLRIKEQIKQETHFITVIYVCLITLLYQDFTYHIFAARFVLWSARQTLALQSKLYNFLNCDV